MSRRRNSITAEEVLEALRRERHREIALAELGTKLVEIGISYSEVRAFMEAGRDAQRRAHLDDDGEFHPATKCEIDSDDPRGLIDFEVMACLADDERRYEEHRNALASSTRLPCRLTDDEPCIADELAIAPEWAAVHDIEAARESELITA